MSPECTTVDALSADWRSLVECARRARDSAYAPYSHYAVGAAIRAASGQVYTGCNVENASYGLTVCAERVALWHAVSEGERAFQALAVVTRDGGPPCGACRQVLCEFSANMPIALADTAGRAYVTALSDLLPNPFTLTDAQASEGR